MRFAGSVGLLRRRDPRSHQSTARARAPANPEAQTTLHFDTQESGGASTCIGNAPCPLDSESPRSERELVRDVS